MSFLPTFKNKIWVEMTLKSPKDHHQLSRRIYRIYRKKEALVDYITGMHGQCHIGALQRPMERMSADPIKIIEQQAGLY